MWAQTPEGMRGFLIERGTRGFSSEEIKHKFSLRASNTGALFFDEVALPGDAMLPGASGIRAPLSCLSQARYGICWGALGAAQACLAEALAHAGERVLFGRALTHTQAVQLRLAAMVRALAGAQLLALQLGRLKQRNALSAAQISLGKWNNCRIALDIARDCRDLLGGAGISVEHVGDPAHAQSGKCRDLRGYRDHPSAHDRPRCDRDRRLLRSEASSPHHI